MSVLSLETPGNRLLSPKEVAEVLGLKRDTVYLLQQNGDLPSRKIGSQRRTWLHELHDWVAKQ